MPLRPDEKITNIVLSFTTRPDNMSKWKLVIAVTK